MSHKKYRAEKICLNCGAVVEKKFCPECGQENVEIHDSFLHMAGHFMADYFHYDSKFFTNLRLLITRPGFLTKEYLEGKRVRHVHPLRLFFFITIVMVVAANLYYNKFESEYKRELERNLTYTDDQGKLISREEAERIYGPEITTNFLRRMGTGVDLISHYLKYISFFLLPVYALVFKLLYSRRKKTYVGHLVYTLHLQSFLYLVLILVLLFVTYIFPLWKPVLVNSIMMIIAFGYIMMSLRFLYQQSWLKTILKSAIATVLIGFITIIVTVFVVVIPLLGDADKIGQNIN